MAASRNASSSGSLEIFIFHRELSGGFDRVAPALDDDFGDIDGKSIRAGVEGPGAGDLCHYFRARRNEHLAIDDDRLVSLRRLADSASLLDLGLTSVALGWRGLTCQSSRGPLRLGTLISSKADVADAKVASRDRETQERAAA